MQSHLAGIGFLRFRNRLRSSSTCDTHSKDDRQTLEAIKVLNFLGSGEEIRRRRSALNYHRFFDQFQGCQEVAWISDFFPFHDGVPIKLGRGVECQSRLRSSAYRIPFITSAIE